ncbi:hypothetical protein AAF712_007668 [Marasmius tenuissimus]|uniref:Uncharacterized protein n=1 Tax=Marasmius tenuissimus TaxID=585030 RepID=A0ABR2ZX09_9AGAR
MGYYCCSQPNQAYIIIAFVFLGISAASFIGTVVLLVRAWKLDRERERGLRYTSEEDLSGLAERSGFGYANVGKEKKGGYTQRQQDEPWTIPPYTPKPALDITPPSPPSNKSNLHRNEKTAQLNFPNPYDNQVDVFPTLPRSRDSLTFREDISSSDEDGGLSEDQEEDETPLLSPAASHYHSDPRSYDPSFQGEAATGSASPRSHKRKRSVVSELPRLVIPSPTSSSKAKAKTKSKSKYSPRPRFPLSPTLLKARSPTSTPAYGIGGHGSLASSPRSTYSQISAASGRIHGHRPVSRGNEEPQRVVERPVSMGRRLPAPPTNTDIRLSLGSETERGQGGQKPSVT